MVELAKKSLLGKARARPDLVKKVIEKVKSDGIIETWRQVMGRLDTPMLLGYSSAGVVEDVGPGVEGIKVGDRVAASGSGYAGHVEVASVPANLCAPIPDGVTAEDAAFVAVGAIALEAVRMAEVVLGSRVVVIGLGLIGQIVVQLLRASGCHVLGADPDPAKSALAVKHGSELVVTGTGGAVIEAGSRWASDGGADAVIITASASSNEPLETAAACCRERGRVVATGMVGLEVPRQHFYDKELEFVVSRAWGPGLHDRGYSHRQADYPLPYPRWTARRNMAEFLAQVASGSVSVSHLVTHRYPLADAVSAYEMLLAGREQCIGVVLTYPQRSGSSHTADRTIGYDQIVWSRDASKSETTRGELGISVIGAGLFANGTMLPAAKSLKGLTLRGIASSSGLSARNGGRKFGFDYHTTSVDSCLEDDHTDIVLILTRHDSHADLAIRALAAGKHVLVEKPMATEREQLSRLFEAYCTAINDAQNADRVPPQLLVGFNRRFSPFTTWLGDNLRSIPTPYSMNMTVNAGLLAADSWIWDQNQGGGRIVGEVCHFIDLAQTLTRSMPTRVFADKVSAQTTDDSVASTIHMANGSVAHIGYFASGDRSHLRERVEVFGGGAVGTISNFKSASFRVSGKLRRKRSLFRIDRGHRAEVDSLVRAVRTGSGPVVPIEQHIATTLASLALNDSLIQGSPQTVDIAGFVQSTAPHP